MRRLLILVLAGLAACTGVGPTASSTPDATLALWPLPMELSVQPRPGTPTSARLPVSPPGEVRHGALYDFELGHCGLLSPIDFDGSLWLPVAGGDGHGGPLSENQHIELINSTRVTLSLLDGAAAHLRTPLGAVITLARHDGAWAYPLCD